MHAVFKTPRTFLPRLATGFLAVLSVVLWAAGAQAQGLIRDAEIEETLKRIAEPVFKSAGVSASAIEILVVNDSSLNAFVVDNRAIFLNSGLILRLKSMDMLQSVIAHELAHIISGHIMRRSLNQQNAATAVGLGMLLSAIVSANGNGEAATGLAIGVADGIRNTLMAHTRAEEATADQIGTQYLVMAGIDPAASVRVLNLFKDQEALTIDGGSGFGRTHPLSDERIQNLESLIRIYGGTGKPASAELTYRYLRMKAKFRGFLAAPSLVLRGSKTSDQSEPALLLRAVAYHRLPDSRKSMAEIDTLLGLRPDDPYYRELKGQFLLENGNASGAVASYETAVGLAPNEALIWAGYGRALLALDTTAGNKQALEALNRARDKDPRDPSMLRDLAIAWAKAGNNGMASLVTAERYALLTNFKDAQTNAVRAEGLLPPGSSGWLRAQDIIAATKIALAK